MADLKSRQNTFMDWPLELPCRNRLAECGFYFIKVFDITVCFCCQLLLGNWKNFHDPWLEHYLYSSNCAFLLHRLTSWNVKNLCQTNDQIALFLNMCEKQLETTNCEIERTYIYLWNFKTISVHLNDKILKSLSYFF